MTPQEDRVLDEYDGFTDSDFERDHFVGLHSSILMQVIDKPNDPSFGFKLDINSSFNYNVKTPARTLRFNSSFTVYIPLLASPRVTLANRIGYSHVFGEPELYQLPSLGRNNFLRPYRNDGYRGDGIFFHQIDLRARLFNWNNNFFPMAVGITGGYDYAKAFLQEYPNSNWLDGYSVGLSLNILDAFVVHPFMSFSEEGNFFNLATGYSF